MARIEDGWRNLVALLAAEQGRRLPRQKLARVVDEAPEPALLQRRIDALTLAYKGELSTHAVTALEAASRKARETRAPQDVDFGGGVVMHMTQHSRPGWWVLDTEEWHVTVSDPAPGDWRVEVKPRALLLGRRSLRDVLDAAERLARQFLWIYMGERVRRVDFAADFRGFGLEAIDPDGWLLPSWRASVQDISRFSEFRRRGIRTGFVIGRSDVMLRCYDKTEELDLPENAGPKRDEEHARWTRKGWQRSERVARVEFQLRGQVLDKLKSKDQPKDKHKPERTMRDPRVLLGELDEVWHYLTREWIRLIVTGTATRRERCKVDRRWLAVQAVSFVAGADEPAVREHRRGEPQRARIVLTALRTESLGGLIDAEAEENRETWPSPEEAWAYAKRRLGCTSLQYEFEQAQDEAATVLLRRFHGDRMAVAKYLVKVQRAERARGASLTDALTERAAIEAA